MDKSTYVALFHSRRWLRPLATGSAWTYWPWLAGVFTLAIATKVFFVDLPDRRAESRELLTHSSARETPSENVRPVSSPSLVLLPALPSFDRLSFVVDDLQAGAAANGLTISDAVYKQLDDLPGSNIGHVEIVAHLKGGYVPLKKSLGALLAAHESLALESVSFLRGHSTDASVNVEAHFSFFYRHEP